MTINRVQEQSGAIWFTQSRPAHEPSEVPIELDPLASVKVDGAEVPLSAVQIGKDATIIARIDIAPERPGKMTVTAIKQPP